MCSSDLSATVFTLSQSALVSGGSVYGSSGSDTVQIRGSALDLTGTTLISIEALQAGSTATLFTVDTTDLSGLAVTGGAGNDTLMVKSAAIDLTSNLLTSVDILKAGLSVATTFTVDAADLASKGSVIGSSGTDTLIILGTSMDLNSTGLSSVEILKTTDTSGVTFNINLADLASGGSVVGASGTDMLQIVGTSLDLRSTTLSSIEVLHAGTTSATTFTVDQADLIANGSVIGSTGSDTLKTYATSLDLRSTTLTSIETLLGASTSATTFTIDGDGAGLKITGGTGADKFTFVSGYAQSDHTDDASILAQTATIMFQDHDALTFQYPEHLEDEIVPIIQKQLVQTVPLQEGREMRIPFDCKVGWNKGDWSEKNPDGLKDYKGGDERKRQRQVSILDRKVR